ncbi:hypothetical protein TRVA0_022S01420 [Trichomonascus vanleenenianus]|uniref:uncharacterized protein n=1 Tax=Trichomonascus vanleenenianus TaxID=2268995 RepID=UPI003ECA6F73
MTSSIFLEWLCWFDSRLNREILLIMDNFTAHELAVNTVANSGQGLKNVVVVWLPPNSASLFQPLDQGIIRAWKVHWRRRWVRFLLTQYEAGEDPLSTMNILFAIRWAIGAWEQNVKTAIIQNSFRKGIYGEQVTSSSPEVLTQIADDIRKLRDEHFIREAMDINAFLNPAGEDVVDNLNEIEEQIIARFQPEEPEDSDEEVEQLRVVSHQEALEMLQGLRLYQEQTGGNKEPI